MPIDATYLEEIKKRRKSSKVYKEFQLTGLEVAELLADRKHKSLYIRLAKTADKSRLIAIAKDVANRKSIKNLGAYFMKVWQKEKLAAPKKGKKFKYDPKSEIY